MYEARGKSSKRVLAKLGNALNEAEAVVADEAADVVAGNYAKMADEYSAQFGQTQQPENEVAISGGNALNGSGR